MMIDLVYSFTTFVSKLFLGSRKPLRLFFMLLARALLSDSNTTFYSSLSVLAIILITIVQIALILKLAYRWFQLFDSLEYRKCFLHTLLFLQELNTFLC